MSNNIYFTPGPSQLFYTFEEHLKRGIAADIPSISHRSSKFIDVVKSTTDSLRELLSLPDDYDIFFINSANEAWDRIIQNLVEDSSHHFVNGAFSQKFYDFAISHHKNSTITKVEDGYTFPNWSVPDKSELIAITKNETSVGFSVAEDEIADLRKSYPDKIIALDIVSASPSLNVNFANVDTAYFSVQKAFGLPAGLGVWIANKKCLDVARARASATSIGSYRSLANLKKFGDKDQTPETPNMLYIYLLGKIAEDMIGAGIKRIQNDTTYKATILSQVIDNHPQLSHFISSTKHRSKTTLVANADDPQNFINYFKKKGLILGSGYGAHKGNHIRIANFPTHSKESVEMLCDMIEAMK